MDVDTATSNGSSSGSGSSSSSDSFLDQDDNGNLVAAELPLFFNGQDDDDENSSDEDRSGSEHSGGNHEGSSNGDSDSDRTDADAIPDELDGNEEDPDPPPRSQHGQQLLDELIGDYTPGPRPQRAPRAADLLISLDDLSPSEKASVKHFRTFVRKDLTVAGGRLCRARQERRGCGQDGRDQDHVQVQGRQFRQAHHQT
ncbi:unnamed protein product [Tilletia controversa]|nr:unnamed protein product [Tilletia controversa]CAD6908476.1 unnamed protein product [Tilletia controversa]CAD6983500.1 unnamed protein product [Tilletia controversa]